MRDAILRDINTDVFKMSTPGAEIISIAPKNLSAHFATRNKAKLQETFERGVQDALAPELRNLFNV